MSVRRGVVEKVGTAGKGTYYLHFQNVYRELVDSWRLYDNSGERAILLEES